MIRDSRCSAARARPCFWQESADRWQSAAACAGAAAAPLTPPADGAIDVALLISRGAVVIDFCGPWEVFSGVNLPGRSAASFRLYTVAASQAAVSASGGLQIVPNFTFASAPPPRIIVIPAQNGAGEAALGWIRRASAGTDLTMSVQVYYFCMPSHKALFDANPERFLAG